MTIFPRIGRAAVRACVCALSLLLGNAAHSSQTFVGYGSKNAFGVEWGTDVGRVGTTAGFSGVLAHSMDTRAAPTVDHHVLPGPKPYWDANLDPAGPYTTRVTARSGPRYVANAQADARVSKVFKGAASSVVAVVWSDGLSYATVEAVSPPPSPLKSELARAAFFVGDPMHFVVEPGDLLFASLFMPAGTILGAGALPDADTAFASLAFAMNIDLPGYGDVVSMSLRVDRAGAADALLAFSFVSASVLGLDDAQISSDFLAALAFDPVTGAASLGADFSFYDLTIRVPDGINAVTMSGQIDGQAQMNAAAVPEPSTLMLSVVGGLLLFACTRRRRADR